MMNTIKNELVSISELKKAPMNVVKLAEEKGDAVYILNNNKDVGVIISVGNYEELISATNSLKKKNEELEELLLQMKKEQSAIRETMLLETTGTLDIVRERVNDTTGFTDVDDLDWDQL